MEYKPWPLLILAFFHFIEPILKISFYSVYFQINPLDVIAIEYQAGSTRHVFEYFFLFPIAGIAIFAIKKWSFPVFIGVEVWAFISNIPYLNELYQANQLLLLCYFIFFIILNVTVVSYLLIPAVRIAYLDPRIRWWEAKPRYSISIEGKVDNHPIGTIKNISESGVFLATQKDLAIDSEIDLQFTFTMPLDPPNEFEINLKASVLHKFTIDKHEGYGISYINLNSGNTHLIHSMIKALETSNVKRRPPRRNIIDLINWVTTFVKTGKGLFPKKTH